MRTTYYISIFPYKISTELPTKGKPTPKIKQTKPIRDDGSDEPLSPLSDGSRGHSDNLDGSDDEDDDEDEDDNEFDVARMTEREIRQLYNDEVTFFVLASVLN